MLKKVWTNYFLSELNCDPSTQHVTSGFDPEIGLGFPFLQQHQTTVFVENHKITRSTALLTDNVCYVCDCLKSLWQNDCAVTVC